MDDPKDLRDDHFYEAHDREALGETTEAIRSFPGTDILPPLSLTVYRIKYSSSKANKGRSVVLFGPKASTRVV